MALNLLLDRRLTSGHLDCRLVLLHRCFAAVLRSQRTVAGRSDWLARLHFRWAIRLTRHPRNTQEVLLSGSWLEVPTRTIIINDISSNSAGICYAHTISMIFPWLRTNGALRHRKICWKHSILTEVAGLIRGSDWGYSVGLYKVQYR
jgi:hypothetical protein